MHLRFWAVRGTLICSALIAVSAAVRASGARTIRSCDAFPLNNPEALLTDESQTIHCEIQNGDSFIEKVPVLDPATGKITLRDAADKDLGPGDEAFKAQVAEWIKKGRPGSALPADTPAAESCKMAYPPDRTLDDLEKLASQGQSRPCWAKRDGLVRWYWPRYDSNNVNGNNLDNWKSSEEKEDAIQGTKQFMMQAAWRTDYNKFMAEKNLKEPPACTPTKETMSKDVGTAAPCRTAGGMYWAPIIESGTVDFKDVPQDKLPELWATVSQFAKDRAQLSAKKLLPDIDKLPEGSKKLRELCAQAAALDPGFSNPKCGSAPAGQPIDAAAAAARKAELTAPAQLEAFQKANHFNGLSEEQLIDRFKATQGLTAGAPGQLDFTDPATQRALAAYHARKYDPGAVHVSRPRPPALIQPRNCGFMVLFGCGWIPVWSETAWRVRPFYYPQPAPLPSAVERQIQQPQPIPDWEQRWWDRMKSY